ncbi:unnamed protein product [Hymenolepis diminuta]|uniref:Uncharacterized protein n=1 Tax=Hymenolepis diminuta TaxID=6216 RepID=A0A564Z7V4_HYMDI|nr:unnamed protein product [Hymenolepis diminuta]
MKQENLNFRTFIPVVWLSTLLQIAALHSSIVLIPVRQDPHTVQDVHLFLVEIQ